MFVRNIVGAQEIADRIGVAQRQTVINWARRYADFPQPIAKLTNAWVWDWDEVESWARSTGRLPAPAVPKKPR